MKKICFLLLCGSLFLFGCKKKSIERNCCISPPFKQIFPGGSIYVPNIFTPDGDGLNDVFEPIAFGVVSYSIEVLSTKKTLYQSTDSQPWDGTYNGSRVRDIVGWKISIRTVNAEDFIYTGQVCALVESDGICPAHLDDCAFASQFSQSQQTFDMSIPSGETFCID